jgi:hypothetical protein
LHAKYENNQFELLYSYSNINYPHKKYDSNSEFLWFKNVYVEARERVKFLSGRYGELI